VLLAGLEERYLNGDSIGHNFDLIVGTSTGGLICCAFAAGKSANEIAEIYLERGGLIFPKTSARTALRWFVSSRDADQLRRLISEIAGTTQIWESPHRICVPSCEAKNQDIYIWKTPHHPDYMLDWLDPISAAATATASAPTFFQQFAHGRFEHLDGALFANNPALIGVVEAVTAFDVLPENVDVLSLGCGDYGGPKLNWLKRNLGGYLTWFDVYKWFTHFQEAHVLGLVSLLVGPENHIRINPSITGSEIAMDDHARAAHVLPPIAQELLNTHGEEIANVFLQTRADPYSRYYCPDTTLSEN
jgi:hypothetical protein